MTVFTNETRAREIKFKMAVDSFPVISALPEVEINLVNRQQVFCRPWRIYKEVSFGKLYSACANGKSIIGVRKVGHIVISLI